MKKQLFLITLLATAGNIFTSDEDIYYQDQDQDIINQDESTIIDANNQDVDDLNQNIDTSEKNENRKRGREDFEPDAYENENNEKELKRSKEVQEFRENFFDAILKNNPEYLFVDNIKIYALSIFELAVELDSLSINSNEFKQNKIDLLKNINKIGAELSFIQKLEGPSSEEKVNLDYLLSKISQFATKKNKDSNLINHNFQTFIDAENAMLNGIKNKKIKPEFCLYATNYLLEYFKL